MANSSYLDLTLVALLFVASVFDVTQRRIPNRLLLVALIAAIGIYLMTATPIALLTSCLSGFVVGLFLFLPLYIFGVMAAGDVKLMAVVGAFAGPALALEIALASYCFGGVLALAISISMRRGREALANVSTLLRPVLMRLSGLPAPAALPVDSVGGMPYALAISCGSLLILWLRHT